MELFLEKEEQLDRINEGLDKINEDMKDAEKNLDDLDKCCGLCILPWTKIMNIKSKNYEKTWKDEEDGKDVGTSPRIMVDQNGGAVTGGFITRITNDAAENEIDQNLQEVTGMIGNLRNMAIDMGSEMNQQTKQVDQIILKAQVNQERIKKANDQANKLLK